jgi:hypothetical protein
MNHVIHRDMRGIGVSQNDHSQRVANQQQIEPALVEKARSGVIIGRERSQTAAFSLSFAK